jgi:hypothetical protein
VQQNYQLQYLSCAQIMVTLCRALRTVISPKHLHDVDNSYSSL